MTFSKMSLNLTRILVTVSVAVSEFAINFFAFKIPSFNEVEFASIMLQDMVVMPTVGYFVTKFNESASGISESTSKQ